MIAVVAPEAPPLSHGDVLGLLLSVEGFLFAAITLSATLSVPNRGARRYEWLKPDRILVVAAFALLLIGAGALVPWGAVYLGGSWQGGAIAVEGSVLLVAVVSQPLLALLLAMSARR